MEKSDTISIALKEKYGSAFDGRARWRLVWSEEQTEKYSGEREVWVHGIFLRQEKGLREVKKYGYLKDRFVLERLVYMEVPDLPESSNGHYEPVYVFQTKDLQYLEPNLLVCEMVINWLLYRKIDKILDWENEEKKKEALELQSYFDFFEESDTALALRIGEGVTVPGNYNPVGD